MMDWQIVSTIVEIGVEHTGLLGVLLKLKIKLHQLFTSNSIRDICYAIISVVCVCVCVRVFAGICRRVGVRLFLLSPASLS